MSRPRTSPWSDDSQGNQFNLLRSVSAQQTLNAAGRDFQLQRTMQFSDYSINTPHFEQDLDGGRTVPTNRCIADTDQGLRELKNKGGERVVQADQPEAHRLAGGRRHVRRNLQLSHSHRRHQRGRFRLSAHRRAAFRLFCRTDSGHRSLETIWNQVSPGRGPGALRSARREPHLLAQRQCIGKATLSRKTSGHWEQTLGGTRTLAGNHVIFSPTAYTYLAYDIYPPDQRHLLAV